MVGPKIDHRDPAVVYVDPRDGKKPYWESDSAAQFRIEDEAKAREEEARKAGKPWFRR
jgi:hypothetical protein